MISSRARTPRAVTARKYERPFAFLIRFSKLLHQFVLIDVVIVIRGY